MGSTLWRRMTHDPIQVSWELLHVIVKFNVTYNYICTGCLAWGRVQNYDIIISTFWHHFFNPSVRDFFFFFFSCLFTGQNDDELSCAANETVVVIEDLGDGWLRVRKGQDEGYVPQAYVQIVEWHLKWRRNYETFFESTFSPKASWYCVLATYIIIIWTLPLYVILLLLFFFFLAFAHLLISLPLCIIIIILWWHTSNSEKFVLFLFSSTIINWVN